MSTTTPVDAQAQIEKIRVALRRFHLALDNRSHGGVAACDFTNEVEHILGIPWVKGAVLIEEVQKSSDQTPAEYQALVVGDFR